jgi:hypothetical protein
MERMLADPAYQGQGRKVADFINFTVARAPSNPRRQDLPPGNFRYFTKVYAAACATGVPPFAIDSIAL